MKPLISVIVPIYNVEAYLYRGVSSLVNQTLKEIEIICIDDGSTDFSFDIISKMAKKDVRIKIIKNEKNMGVAYSRNLGISEAKGEYIAFLDPDDWFDLNFLEKTYKKAKENDFDIVKAYTRKVYVDDRAEDISANKKIVNAISKKTFLPLYYNYGFWSSLYKRYYLLENKTVFPNLINGEDIVFLLKALCLTNKIGFVEDVYYNYYQRGNSASYTIKEANAYSVLKHFALQLEFLNKIPIEKQDYLDYFKVLEKALTKYWRQIFIKSNLSDKFYNDYKNTVNLIYDNSLFKIKRKKVSVKRSKLVKYYTLGVVLIGAKKIGEINENKN